MSEWCCWSPDDDDDDDDDDDELCVACSATPPQRNIQHRHPMRTTTACCRRPGVAQHVLKSQQQTIAVRRGRHRCTRPAVLERASRQVIVTSAMHQMVTVSPVVHRVLRAAAVSRRTVIHRDVVHLPHQQQLPKQVLIDTSLIGIIVINIENTTSFSSAVSQIAEKCCIFLINYYYYWRFRDCLGR